MPHASQILYLAVNFSLFTENHVESTVPYSSSDSVAGSEETQQSLTVNGATSDKTTSKQSKNGHRGIYSKVEGDHPLVEGLSINRDKLSIETDLVYETHDFQGEFRGRAGAIIYQLSHENMFAMKGLGLMILGVPHYEP